MSAPATVDAGLIFDFGMDQAGDTGFYLQKGFRVVAVDANPQSCRKAEQRFAAEIADGRLVVVNRAVSDSGQPLIFYACEQPWTAWGTASPKWRDLNMAKGGVFHEVEVEPTTSAELIETYGVPYYAKIDIEGSDLLCMEGFKSASVAPTYMSSEVEFRDGEYRRQIECMQALGYKRFALVSQKDVPNHPPPRPAREGMDIDYTFTHHCSGVFGRELTSEWKSADEVLRVCSAIAVQSKIAGAMNKAGRNELRNKMLPRTADWYDIHASF